MAEEQTKNTREAAYWENEKLQDESIQELAERQAEIAKLGTLLTKPLKDKEIFSLSVKGFLN